MALVDNKITLYAKSIASLSDTPNADGLTAAQLKAMFDGRTNEEVKASINGIIDTLLATTDSASGADQIGATTLKVGGATTVQGQIEEVKADLLAQILSTILGQIPDGSLTDAKLGDDVKVGSLANLTTTEKGNVVGAVNEVDGAHKTHAAESVSDTDGVHGLIVKTIVVTTDFSLVNGWVVNVTQVRFTKIGNRIFANGGIKDGVITKGTTIFTLPVGFRPSTVVFAPVTEFKTGAVSNLRLVRINTDGTVIVDNNTDWVDGQYWLNFNYYV